MGPVAAPPPLRPRLLPASRRARVALGLLIAFALLRSVLWASVQPGWFAPDEDYHWLYVNYLVEQHAVPDLDRPFATRELYAGVVLTHQAVYFPGPRRDYRGEPHAVLAALAARPRSERRPTAEPPRPVLHPPLYHLGAAAVDAALGGRVSVTRMTALRYYSALVGALGVFFAWLLAAQVLAREWQQLAAAALVATQPIIAFSSSTITNDVAVLASLTAVLAWCAFLLRSRPASRQGIGLGLVLTAALFSKATTIIVLPLVALVLLVLWRTRRDAARQVLGIAAWAAGIVGVLAAWWYVRVYAVTGNPLGARGALGGVPIHPKAGSAADALDVAWGWLGQVYRGYWFDYNVFEVRTLDFWFYLPLVAGILGFAAFVAVLALRRLRPAGVARRQMLVLATVPLLLVGGPLLADTSRGVRGLGFAFQQGRFLTPAFPAVAVVLVATLCRLIRRPRRLAATVGGLVLLGFAFYWHTWVVWTLERFYGPVDGHFLRLLRHATFDKPAWVTSGFLLAVMLLAGASFLAAFALVSRGALRGERGPAERDARVVGAVFPSEVVRP